MKKKEMKRQLLHALKSARSRSDSLECDLAYQQAATHTAKAEYFTYLHTQLMARNVRRMEHGGG